MSNVVPMIKGIKQAPRAMRSRMDTLELTVDLIDKWRKPSFQRPLKVNAKVRAVAEELKTNGGVIPGVITVGVWRGQWYIVDGQHRLEAFRLAAIDKAYADVRIVEFDSLADMAEEFGDLQSSLVVMTPDDKLRALEEVLPPVRDLRKRCPFIGYDQIRRGPNSPLLRMSLVLRCWDGSATEVPSPRGGVVDVAKALTMDESERLSDFLDVIYQAWGQDEEYGRLWGALNLITVMWLWRRTVTGQYSAKTTKLTKTLFGKCAMALSADGHFLEWIVGRNRISKHDRSPCYARIKKTFAARLVAEDLKPLLPQPPWSHK